MKQPKRKQKSHSSAAEMINFLKGYNEKREKVEEENVHILKVMQEGKKHFFCFSSFLKDTKKRLNY